MSNTLIKSATIINEGRRFVSDLLIKDEDIFAIGNSDEMEIPAGTKIIDASGMLLLPGIIDDQVHFRQPGLTHKGDIYSESRAAAAGGIVSEPAVIPCVQAAGQFHALGGERQLYALRLRGEPARPFLLYPRCQTDRGSDT